MKTLLASIFAATAAVAGVEDLNWTVDTYEPRPPIITGSVASGFHGAVTPMKRMDMRAVNALSDANRSWSGVAWRNERVNAQFALWTRESAEQVRVKVTDLKSADGTIPSSVCRARFVRYVLSSQVNRDGVTVHPEKLIGDCLDTAVSVDMPPNSYRPFWFTVDVPAEAKPGRTPAR